ncbi:pyocin knob domain-containing protein [Lentilactobacillus parabuchneri]|uniref:pyocin knob domain-containing protein n=1 Tax=Lentilactobacillus parabuchneri TaxID=152331 RepID=UPI0009472EF0|nr:pyocin knob domain-containing protein [Lentilactobacillus parabuchneri]APR08346.1 hypothetical protein FAM21731_02209 [Lentilactobacillus parabuchneri]
MQKMGDTIITDLGMDLLSSVNNGDDKITYTKTVLAADDLTQESDVDIQKTTSLKLIQQTTGKTVISRVDNTVNLGATFTNKEVTQNFDFYVIGWYAKGSAVITDERLFAITPSTVKQTMPAGKDGAATAAISPKYASALSRSATVSLNPDQAGTVTPEYVDQKIQQIISEGIVNGGSTLSESDNLDSFITTGYHLIKGSLPLSAPEGFSTNGQIIVYGNKDTTDGVTQLAYDDINGTSYVRSYNPTNNKWSDWDLVITKSQLNAVLPTGIARTGENNDFKGKNTFETDPVDKNGDAYGLAKDIATKVTDNGDNSIEINKQAVTPVRDNKNGSINFNSKDMTPADDSAVVHTTGDETIDGQKKFKTDPTDGAGNAYAKTVDVNQQLDKKVNIADMRKPASDVAGIEEVNAKQDKIGYTPADDSKVVHDNKDGTEQLNGVQVQPYNKLSDVTNLRNIVLQTDNVIPYTAKGKFGEIVQDFYLYSGFSSLPSGTQIYYSYDLVVTNADGGVHWLGWGVPWTSFVSNQHLTKDGIHHFQGTTTIPDASIVSGQFIHSTIDNSHATYQITNLMIVVGSIPVTHLPAPEDKADNSKVAHLSGTNNFDTVPTVKNNPLLLASSLPSDLARTGQAQTFTAAQTFSIAPVINDASTDKGDNQAATMADLKSVEESAWRQLDSSLITVDIGTIPYTNCLYKIDPVNKKIYIQWMMKINYETNYGNAYLDFSSVVSKFTSKGSGHMLYKDANHRTSETISFSISGSKISVDAEQTSDIVVSGYLEDCWFGYDTLLI